MMQTGEDEVLTLETNDLLRNFLESNEKGGGESALGELLVRAVPQVRRILAQKMAAAGVVERQDLEDLAAEVLSEMLYRLRRIKASPDAQPIQSFANYTATIVYRAYSDHLRRKYPRRHRLKTQLRYLLQVDKRFELREEPHHLWFCCLAQWTESLRQTRKTPTREEIARLSDEFATGRTVSRPAEFLAKLLKRLAAPVELNDLIGMIAEFWGIHDHASATLDEAEVFRVAAKADGRDVVEMRQWLARLWTEITALPLPQRRAMLLNLRDEGGGEALALVPMSGIASIPEIADVLEMDESELSSLWNQLPIDDIKVAERLGLTRQQVINLRKCARARLTRRMAAL